MIQPQEPALKLLVQRGLLLLGALDPLVSAQLGEPLRLPEPDGGREARLLVEVAGLHDALEALPEPASPADSLDRESLLFGLRRALAAALLPDPSAAPVLERHLMVCLSRLLLDGLPAFDWLTELAEAGPAVLTAGRRPATVSREAGELALDAARRLPALLHAAAAAAAEMGLEAPRRHRLEAALGPLQQAGAEDAGRLLKEYLPAAVPGDVDLPDPEATGLGMSLDELEAEAESALAESIGADEPVSAAAETEAARATVEDARRALAAAAAAHPAAPAGELPEVVAAPAWFLPLMPALALVQPGPLSPARSLLFVGAAPRATLDVQVGALYWEEILPASWRRAEPRLARELLPAPDAHEGWRSHVRSALPRIDPPWPRELRWRAALALCAINMTHGRAGVDTAAQMLAAESGLAPEQARLQALHVARRPLAALTFVAGRRKVARLLGSGDQMEPALLAAGPLPAALVDHL